jgi:hypothetical protein
MAQLAMLDQLERLVPTLDDIIHDGRLGHPSAALVDDIQSRILELAGKLTMIATGGSTHPSYNPREVSVRSRPLKGGGIAVY